MGKDEVVYYEKRDVGSGSCRLPCPGNQERGLITVSGSIFTARGGIGEVSVNIQVALTPDDRDHRDQRSSRETLFQSQWINGRTDGYRSVRPERTSQCLS